MTTSIPALPSILRPAILPVSRLALLQDRANRDRLLAQLDQRITLVHRKGQLVDIKA